MNLNVKNETSTLKAVVLGQAGSRGQIPTPDKTYDAKSYESVQKGIYPTEEATYKEMSAFEKVLRSGLPVRFKKVADRGAMMALFRAGYFPQDYIEFVEATESSDAYERAAWMSKDLAKMQEKGITDTKKSRTARFLDFKRMAVWVA